MTRVASARIQCSLFWWMVAASGYFSVPQRLVTGIPRRIQAIVPIHAAGLAGAGLYGFGYVVAQVLYPGLFSLKRSETYMFTVCGPIALLLGLCVHRRYLGGAPNYRATFVCC